MDERTIETITKKVLEKLNEGGSGAGQTSAPSARQFPVGVSARHVHLSKEDLATLFGPGYELQVYKMLKQPAQFAAKEQVAVVGPRDALYGVRILGPSRSGTQVELSLSDGLKLGIQAPVRDSGVLEGSPGCVLLGPKGSVALKQGVIVAARHLHVEPARAAQVGLKDKDRVKVRCPGGPHGRGLVFENVLVRSGDAHLAEFHVDTDEANAAGLCSGELIEIIQG